ncbi:MAG: hypothetical protein OEY33_00900 [Bdellovibrionales bacterium]|nr:hypothetical protein [Bdellovibrionales bacterium]
MKALLLLTITSFLFIGCGKSEQGATAATSVSNGPIKGVPDVVGNTDKNKFRTLVAEGKFFKPEHDYIKFFYQSFDSQSFSRALLDKTIIERDSNDPMASAKTHQQIIDHLVKVIDNAKQSEVLPGSNGTIWRFMDSNNAIYEIDLNYPLALNPISKWVINPGTNSDYLGGLITINTGSSYSGYTMIKSHYILK